MKNLKFLIPLLIISMSFLTCEEKQQTNSNTFQVQISVKAKNKKKTSTTSKEIKFDIPGIAQLTKNFYFILDASQSMDGDKIIIAKKAAKEFIKLVPKESNVGLFVFDENGETERIKLGPLDVQAFNKAVDNVPNSNWQNTPLGYSLSISIKKVVEQYKKQLGYGEYRIIVLTDGAATDEDIMKKECNNLISYGFIDLYTIGFQLPGVHDLKKYSTDYREANNLDELKKALVKTTAEAESFDDINLDEL